MRALILCNGTPPSSELLKKCSAPSEVDLIVCCDGAANYAQSYGLRPDALIGDFDSLGSHRAHQLVELWNCDIVELPVKKDVTDAHYATEYAIERGAKELCFLGALGGRFDQALSNVFLLVLCSRLGARGVILDEQNEMRICCTSIFCQGRVGDTLSLIPLGINVRIRCTDGLEYPLYDAYLPLSGTLGVSNVFVKEEAYIEVADGWVLIVQSHD